ncbi:hypothetical protein ACFL27_14960, partial [candidate division CSSED10-310 bacterium]
ITFFLFICLVINLIAVSCTDDDDDDGEPICFKVNGFYASVYHMWSDGSTHTSNLQGLRSFTETISRNGETHTLEWTNIDNNYSTDRTDSFDCKIDGTSYQYPRDEC